MRDSKNVIILSILAVVLVLVIVVALAINPIIGAVLGPLLLGVAAIIRAIIGKGNDDPDSKKTQSYKPDDDLVVVGEPPGTDDAADAEVPDIT